MWYVHMYVFNNAEPVVCHVIRMILDDGKSAECAMWYFLDNADPAGYVMWYDFR